MSVLRGLWATCINKQYGMNFDLARIIPTGKTSKDHARFLHARIVPKIVGADFAWSCKDHASRPDV